MTMPLNRVVALVVALLGLGAAVVPVAANFDWTSTAGVIAGLAAVAAVANRWLIGWQAHEQNRAWNLAAADVPPEPDQGDPGQP